MLNSLSLDFISVSLACLGSGRAFVEIGKRAVWALWRHGALAHGTAYTVVAIDADMTHDAWWMNHLLGALASSAGNTAVTLPLQRFDMQSRAELAFRTLQGGLHTGKVVIGLPHGLVEACGSHLVTGGTGGLGLLTARWLAQRGVRLLTLVSRGGGLPSSASTTERRVLMATQSAVCIRGCDAAQTIDARQLLQPMVHTLDGIWHAAGVLKDSLLPKQDHEMQGRVYAPKAHGAWMLQSALAFSRLQECVLFSSVAALLGGAGQANYSAANMCLDTLACCRYARGLCAVSVQWGGWAEVGMAARGAAGRRMEAMEAAAGFGRISLALGLAALATVVRHCYSAVLALVPVAWGRLLGGVVAVPTFLSAFKEEASAKARPVLLLSSHQASLESVLQVVQRICGAVVDADAPLMEAGVDSLGMVELRNHLQGTVVDGLSLPGTIVFDHPTARRLTVMLQRVEVDPPMAQHPVAAERIESGRAIMVNHQAAQLPGPATSPRTAFLAINCAHDTIGEVPSSRWDPLDSYSLLDPLGSALLDSLDCHSLLKPTCSRARHGGFVASADLFDHERSRISLAEAAAMDPQQRLLLECGYEALHASVRSRTALGGSLTGIFLGISSTEFSAILGGSPAAGSVYNATGAKQSIAAGRLSYVLGLHGPCIAHDTACSSALVACHVALRALQRTECIVGAVAGVMLMLTPSLSVTFAAAGMTSTRGRSHTFDLQADGYARGEACSVSVLHPDGVDLSQPSNCTLSLRGSAVRHDGASASLTAPNGQAQQGVTVAALVDAGTAADSLTLCEAHGTGTALGDPIEGRSLHAASLAPRGAYSAALPVSGAKASIGHGEPAAGSTALIAAAFSLRSGAAPNAQLRHLNPHLSESTQTGRFALPLQVCSVGIPAPTDMSNTSVGAAGMSSFGYSGTIVHAALQRLRQSAQRAAPSRVVYRRRVFAWRPLAPAAKTPPRAGDETRNLLSRDALLALVRAISWSDELDPAVPLVELGVDSLGWTGFIAELTVHVPIGMEGRIPSVIELYAITIDELYSFLLSLWKSQHTVRLTAPVPLHDNVLSSSQAPRVQEPQPPQPVSSADGLAERHGSTSDRSGNFNLARLVKHTTPTPTTPTPHQQGIRPIYIALAEGARVTDVDGREYIDVDAGGGSLLFGHNAPFIRDRVMETLLSSSYGVGFHNPLLDANAHRLSQLVGTDRVSFVNTDVEASALAARLARLHKGRRRIVLIETACQSNLDLSLLHDTAHDTTRSHAAAPSITNSNVPLCGAPCFFEELTVLREHDESALCYIAAHADLIAAVFVEPVQTAGRVSVLPHAFLAELRELTLARGIVLVFDETASGLWVGGGGAQTSGQAEFDVRADLVIYGQVIGGGWPVCAVCGSAELMDPSSDDSRRPTDSTGCSSKGFLYSEGRDVPLPPTSVRSDSTGSASVKSMGSASAGSASAGSAFVASGSVGSAPMGLEICMSAVGAVLEHMEEEGDVLRVRLCDTTARLAKEVNAWWKERGVASLYVAHVGPLFSLCIPPEVESDFYHTLRSHGVVCSQGRACYLTAAHSAIDVQRIIEAVKRTTESVVQGTQLSAEISPAARPVSLPEPSPAARPVSLPHTPTTVGAVSARPSGIGIGKEEKLPVSSLQHQLLMYQQLYPASTAYNEPLALALDVGLTEPIARSALQALLRRHAVLRTYYAFDPSATTLSQVGKAPLPDQTALLSLSCR